MKLTAKFFELPLKNPFTISRYTVNTQQTMIVTISDGNYTGYGEATVNPYYNSTKARLQTSIDEAKTIVENLNKTIHPTELWNLVAPKLADNYFALCAIDGAYWDWYARSKQQPLRRFWSKNDANIPKTNYTIGIDTIATMKFKIQQKPWPIYKIKLGTANDTKIIRSLREITNATFRVDANCAWTVEETLRNAEIFKKLGVEFIEQPLQADDWKGMQILKQQSALPIIADESCQTLQDVPKCVEVFHGINIKLMKCGGITSALQMIEFAKNQGIHVMAGCMTESSIGISNLTQLAPLLDYIDADGALLLQKDIARGVTFRNGTIIYPNANGAGSILQ